MGRNNFILGILIGDFLSEEYLYYERKIINLDLEPKLIKCMDILRIKAKFREN